MSARQRILVVGFFQFSNRVVSGWPKTEAAVGFLGNAQEKGCAFRNCPLA